MISFGIQYLTDLNLSSSRHVTRSELILISLATALVAAGMPSYGWSHVSYWCWWGCWNRGHRKMIPNFLSWSAVFLPLKLERPWDVDAVFDAPIMQPGKNTTSWCNKEVLHSYRRSDSALLFSRGLNLRQRRPNTFELCSTMHRQFADHYSPIWIPNDSDVPVGWQSSAILAGDFAKRQPNNSNQRNWSRPAPSFRRRICGRATSAALLRHSWLLSGARTTQGSLG